MKGYTCGQRLIFFIVSLVIGVIVFGGGVVIFMALNIDPTPVVTFVLVGITLGIGLPTGRFVASRFGRKSANE